MRGQPLRNACALVHGYKERRVRHLQRPIDTLRKDLAERLAGDDLDHAPEDVGRQAILPARARLVEEGSSAQLFDELIHRQGQRGHVGGLRVHLVNLCLAPVAVGQPGGVPHQVLDCHLALGRGPLQADHPVFKRRNVFRYWIGRQQPALLVQRERRHRDDRLGHGRDPKDRVGSHRRAGSPVTKSDRLH